MRPSNVLLIGSGGREHALAWKLCASPQVNKIYVQQSNPAILGVEKVECLQDLILPPHRDANIVQLCKEKGVELVVVGPEDPLANGLADLLAANDIYCFGPCRSAAQIESSKSFSKNLMVENNIATARYETFTDSDDACTFIESCLWDARVVKASGLAAGKGVVVAKDKLEAKNACKSFLDDKKFGKASETIIVEEFLDGVEISALFFCDGETVRQMPLCRDHKKLLEGDDGPNTGGMGSICPLENLQHKQREFNDIAVKTIEGLKKINIKYIGVLYIGLMLTKNDELKVLEYNCRFGDPETQSLVALLESDLYGIMLACVKGTLGSIDIEWSAKFACGVVLASGGYPGQFTRGYPINGLDKIEENENLLVFHAGTKQQAGHIVTNGGRVLCVVAICDTLTEAHRMATQAAGSVTFTDSYYRKDIGLATILNSAAERNGVSYLDAGVSIDAGNQLVTLIKPVCKATHRPGFNRDIGGFGEVFDLKAAGYRDPLLVMGTDGVGTKLKIALAMNKHSTIGVDLVAMCVNDVLCMGAEPLAFLDYYACGKLQVHVAKEVISGIASACKMAKCALVGGETAEMPDFYSDNKYDLAGFCVGAVERSGHILPKLDRICPGDVIVGVASSAIHSNGYSLVHKIVQRERIDISKDKCYWDEQITFGDYLLTPTKIYVDSVLPLIQQGLVLAAAHITGGGMIENIPRVLPTGVKCVIDCTQWHVPPVFHYLSNFVTNDEMVRTFNCGIGMVLVVKRDDVDKVMQLLANCEERAFRIGNIAPLNDKNAASVVELVDVEKLFDVSKGGMIRELHIKKVPVAVLISGSGTNLQALIDYCKWSSVCQIELVISNVAGVKGIDRARQAGITTVVSWKGKDQGMVQSHKGLKREDFDMQIDQCLTDFGIELVCLAGFMRILSEKFVRKWHGRLVNTHPSLLPAFKGAHAVSDALKAGVRISGCTVHFVEPEVDSGAIIAQSAVPVMPLDTPETLQERIKKEEHNIYPMAMEGVASGKIKMNKDGALIFR